MKVLRKYDKYKDYIAHQKVKSTNKDWRRRWLTSEWDSKVQMFYSHFKRVKKYLKPQGRALGICARTGQEIEALNRLGMYAIGVDIVPQPPLVELGDAHHLPHNCNTFDFVFSNSLDHSIYPEVFLNEMRRVLKTTGFGMLHLQLTEEVDAYAENIVVDPDTVIEKMNNVKIYESRPLEDKTYNWEIIFKKL